jgi:molybdenum cofactor cytidylyltransferase
MTPRVAAVVLAAGASTRMGRPKQLLPFRGRSLLRHAVETAAAADLRPIIAILGAHADETEPELAGLPARAVRCAGWERGMGASIRAGAAAVAADDVDAVVLLLCDQPLVGPGGLRALVELHVAGAEVVASAYADTVGAPALFGRAWLARLLALEDGAGAKRLLSAAGAALRTVALPEGAVDVDTPEDYARAHA